MIWASKSSQYVQIIVMMMVLHQDGKGMKNVTFLCSL